MKAASFSLLPFDIEQSLSSLSSIGIGHWETLLRPYLDALFQAGRNGNLPGWLQILKQLPPIELSSFDFSGPVVRLGCDSDLRLLSQQDIYQAFMGLSPWRKGPFQYAGMSIDAEWRSDKKWQRLSSVIQPLAGRHVLDIGCGNGYYALRMIGAGAKRVVGVDPSLLALSQFTALCHGLLVKPAISFLPLGIDQLPKDSPVFDSVFSMGVLYHRRSPIDHLVHLRQLLRPGGELVLETLVIGGGRGQVLVPTGRYAQMRNVWFLPSVDELIVWFHQCFV